MAGHRDLPRVRQDRLPEGAGGMPEEIAQESLLSDPRAVDGDEKALRSGTVKVEDPGEERPPRAAPADEQDRGVRVCEPVHRGEDLLDPRAGSHDRSQQVPAARFRLQEEILLPEQLPVVGLSDEVQDLRSLERFRQVVEGARAHRFDGGVHRRVAGHQDDLGLGLDLLRGPEQFDPVGPGQLQVGEDDVEPVPFEPLDPLKRGSLSKEEFEEIKKHSIIGFEILYGSDSYFLRMAHRMAAPPQARMSRNDATSSRRNRERALFSAAARFS